MMNEQVKKLFASMICLLVILSVATLTEAQSPERERLPYLAIMHVTVIDGTGTPPQPDVTVVIAGYRIVQIGKTALVSMPSRARKRGQA